MSIARFAVTRRVTVAMIATAIVVLGVFAIPRLAVALLPTFSPPVVSVTVSYPNVAPETIETQITRPIENAVSRVSGIDILQSDSFDGSSVVTARFKFGTNINNAAVDVQQQIARIRGQLPNDASLQEPQIIKADPSSLPVVFLFVTDPSRTVRDLGDLYTNQLADEFSAVSGVATVSTIGVTQRAIMVEPRSAALSGNGLSADALVSKIKNENVDLPGGLTAIGPREYQIRTNALYKSASQVGDTVVSIRNGTPVYLRDVARVSDSTQEQRVFTRLNGTPGLRVGVTAQPDANVVSVANGVYAKIDELKHRYPQMQFAVVLDQRGFIQESISALEHTAIYGAALAILIILLFLHSLRSTLIVGITLPISILGTLFAAYMFNETLNTMTLGGLALAVGLIVDDAIVVIENIFRHLSRGESPLQAAENATAQIFAAVFASSVTVITVFVPLLLIPGQQGLIFGPFAIMVMTAVGISLLVAVTTVPMLSSRILRMQDEHSGGRFARWFDARYEGFARWYAGILSWSLDHAAIVLGIGALSFAVALVLLKFGAVATEVFPQSNSRFVRFDFTAPTGTSLARTNEISLAMAEALKRDKLVEALGEAVGTGFGGGGLRAITNRGNIAVTLKEGTSSADAGAFVNTWNRRFGATVRSQNGAGPQPTATPLAASLQEQAKAEQLAVARRKGFLKLRAALVGVTVRGRTIDILQQQIAQGQDALQVQIFGPDITTLSRLAKGVLPQLGQIAGVVRPDTNITDSQPEIDVQVNRRAIAQLGLNTTTVAQAVDTATNGTIASYYQLNGQQYPILVQMAPSERRSFSNLSTLGVTLPSPISQVSTTPSNSAATAASAGSSISLSTVPLASVATLAFTSGPSQISRQNKQRRIDINATVVGRPLGAIVTDAQGVMDSYQLPSGYRWQFGPAITQNQDTFSSLGLIVILAIALIYMLLASQFESFLHPLVIMMSVPLSVVGVVLSLMVTQRSFGLTAFIGTLMLVGIVVKNAILVVEFTNQLRHQGMSARDAIMQAAPLRLRPILMTTLATIAGMLPLAIGFEAGSSTQSPLGTVVIGGLITSTMLTLLVVPTLYLWTARHIEPRFEVKPPQRPHSRENLREAKSETVHV